MWLALALALPSRPARCWLRRSAGLPACLLHSSSRHTRPSCRLEAQRREAKALAKTLAGLRAETGRLNALLADATGQRSALHQDNMTLEAKLAGELRVSGRRRRGQRWVGLEQGW